MADQRIVCPDCPGHISFLTRDAFIAHRVEQHPPEPRVLVAAGIKSEAAFGTDPKE